MNCPKCANDMVHAQATSFGEKYWYCRICKKEFDELQNNGIKNHVVDSLEAYYIKLNVRNASGPAVCVPGNHIYSRPATNGMQYCDCEAAGKIAMTSVDTGGKITLTPPPVPTPDSQVYILRKQNFYYNIPLMCDVLLGTHEWDGNVPTNAGTRCRCYRFRFNDPLGHTTAQAVSSTGPGAANIVTFTP